MSDLSYLGKEEVAGAGDGEGVAVAGAEGEVHRGGVEHEGPAQAGQVDPGGGQAAGGGGRAPRGGRPCHPLLDKNQYF